MSFGQRPGKASSGVDLSVIKRERKMNMQLRWVRIVVLVIGVISTLSGKSVSAADYPAGETNMAATEPAAPPTESGKRSFRDCLLPAIKNGGFRMDDYILWCA